MRYVLTAAAAGAVLAGSANSAHAFFHLLFQSQPQSQTQQYYGQPQHQSQTQQYYRSEPTSRVQISPIPRQTVAFNEGYDVVKTAERRLYLVLEDGKAMRYGVGVGRK